MLGALVSVSPFGDSENTAYSTPTCVKINDVSTVKISRRARVTTEKFLEDSELVCCAPRYLVLFQLLQSANVCVLLSVFDRVSFGQGAASETSGWILRQQIETNRREEP